MKITDVQAIYLRLPEISERCDGTQDALLVKVETDAGITGIGEVDTSPLVAKAAIEAPFSNTITSGLRELVLGEDPFAYEYLWHKMYQGSRYSGRRGAFVHAMSGVDLALWDIMGKATGMPVSRLLGGGFRTKVRAYASTLFGDSLQSTAEPGTVVRGSGFYRREVRLGPPRSRPRLRREARRSDTRGSRAEGGRTDRRGPRLQHENGDSDGGPLRPLRHLLVRGTARPRQPERLRRTRPVPRRSALRRARRRATVSRTPT